jgi:hypothetical protein
VRRFDPAGPPSVSRWRLIRDAFAIEAVVGLLGMAVAMAMATSFWWWDVSASALGTDIAGGRAFNVTMVLLGIGFVPIAVVMNGLLRDATAAGLAVRWWSMSARAGLAVIPFAFALVGFFSIDEGQRAANIHTVAGFLVPLVVMAMMLTIGPGTVRTYPRFSRRTVVILAAIVGMFVLSVTGIMSYALMEMLAFAICWGWLLALARHLDRSLAGSGASGRAGG